MTWRTSAGVYQSTVTNVTVPTDEWHHVAAIYDGATLTLYIDGVAAMKGTKSNPGTTSSPFLIGASGDTPNRFFPWRY